MAFSATNLRRGVAGDLKITAGNWTGSAGDANGSLNVEGGVIYLAQFAPNDTVSPGQEPLVTFSTSGGITTLSIANRETVTAGTFIVIHA